MVGMQLSRVGRDCLATLEEGSLSSPASQWLRGQGWAEWGVGITGQGSPVYSARTHMGTKRLKGPKGPPLQGIRLGPACSGSLKTSAQFREIGDTLSWTSLAKTEAGSPFSSIFSALKPVWKQHRKTSVTRMSGWVRVRGERVPGPWDQAGTARICPVENHELYRESQRQTPLPPPPFLPPTPPHPHPRSPQLQSKAGSRFHLFTILANSKSLQQGRPCGLLRSLWSCRTLLSSPLLLGPS